MSTPKQRLRAVHSRSGGSETLKVRLPTVDSLSRETTTDDDVVQNDDNFVVVVVDDDDDDDDAESGN